MSLMCLHDIPIAYRNVLISFNHRGALITLIINTKSSNHRRNNVGNPHPQSNKIDHSYSV